jgi:hypothetical protein
MERKKVYERRRICTTVATAFASVFLGPCQLLIVVALVHNASEVVQIEAQLGPAISSNGRTWVRRFVFVACLVQAVLCLVVGDLRTQVLSLAASGAPIDVVNCAIGYHYHSGGRLVRILFFSSQFLHLSYVALTVLNCAFPPYGRLLAIPLNCAAVALGSAFIIVQESTDDSSDASAAPPEEEDPEQQSRPASLRRGRSPGRLARTD